MQSPAHGPHTYRWRSRESFLYGYMYVTVLPKGKQIQTLLAPTYKQQLQTDNIHAPPQAPSSSWLYMPRPWSCLGLHGLNAAMVLYCSLTHIASAVKPHWQEILADWVFISSIRETLHQQRQVSGPRIIVHVLAFKNLTQP